MHWLARVAIALAVVLIVGAVWIGIRVREAHDGLRAEAAEIMALIATDEIAARPDLAQWRDALMQAGLIGVPAEVDITWTRFGIPERTVGGTWDPMEGPPVDFEMTLWEAQDAWTFTGLRMLR